MGGGGGVGVFDLGRVVSKQWYQTCSEIEISSAITIGSTVWQKYNNLYTGKAMHIIPNLITHVYRPGNNME